MSCSIKITFSILFAFIFSLNVLAEELPTSLSELRVELQTTIESLKSPTMTNFQRLQIIQQQKRSSEEAMKQLIQNGATNSADLNNPKSDLALSFMYMDQLTALSLLRVHLNSDRLTEESCNDSSGLVRTTNIMANFEEPQTLDSNAQNILNLIHQMCSKSAGF